MFASARPVLREDLARVVGANCNLELILDDIRDELRGRPYEIVAVAGGWSFRTKIGFGEAIRAALGGPTKSELSKPNAVVLMGIAYFQPITRGELSQLLGREVSRDAIAALREEDLIAAGPRSPTPGAPYAYVTTPGFLGEFGFESLRDLPDIEKLQDAGLLGRTVGGTIRRGRSRGRAERGAGSGGRRGRAGRGRRLGLGTGKRFALASPATKKMQMAPPAARQYEIGPKVREPDEIGPKVREPDRFLQNAHFVWLRLVLAPFASRPWRQIILRSTDMGQAYRLARFAQFCAEWESSRDVLSRSPIAASQRRLPDFRARPLLEASVVNIRLPAPGFDRGERPLEKNRARLCASRGPWTFHFLSREPASARPASQKWRRRRGDQIIPPPAVSGRRFAGAGPGSTVRPARQACRSGAEKFRPAEPEQSSRSWRTWL